MLAQKRLATKSSPSTALDSQEEEFWGATESKPLSDTAQDVVNAVKAVRAVLQGDEERQAWEKFAAKYIAFHILLPRYHLLDLLGNE